ncbi:hypothetical protein GGR23_001580 [Gellertiella hungarica]|uniref:Periplasmic protein-like protein n=1 Tax=Gellertiella hungarica TaxID=1572859 RepID=A0A7W6NK17_9HYPH|nr:hypothetical protein [Gellertiella hungarica]MBB4064403.1 hypothetical protein [Gellertiella hungarica]
MRLLILSFGFIVFFFQQAFASVTMERIEVAGGPPLLLIRGEFEFSDSPAILEREAGATGATVVTFDSNGGNVVSAMAFGRAIRALGLSTIQLRSSQCASACTLAFIGGVTRLAEPGSMGVHQSSFSPEDDIDGHVAVAAVQAMTSQIMTYMIEMGVDPKLLQVSLAVAADDMRYLTASEMEEYNVTNAQADPPKSAPPPAHSPNQPVEPNAPSPSAAGSHAPSQAEPSTDESRAQNFLIAYHDAWSRPNSDALRFMEAAYAETVSFYGKTLSRNAIIDEKRTFAERWPRRAYVLRHGSVDVICAMTCTASGIVDWFAHSPERGKMSSGSAEFRVSWDPSSGKIISEAGTVLSTDKGAREPLRVIAQWQAENGLCRGGSGDSDETLKACDRRDVIDTKLRNVGWCYGRPGEYGYQMDWHSCDESTHKNTQGAIVQKAKDLDGPAFRVSELYKGKLRLPDFRKRDRAFNSFRTRIRDGMKAGPNFADRYSVIQFGCGTGCSMVIVGDNKTGRPMDFPLGGEANMYLTLRFNLKSRLMTAQWADFNADRCYVEFLDFDGNAWKQLARQAVGSKDACNRDIAENLE